MTANEFKAKFNRKQDILARSFERSAIHHDSDGRAAAEGHQGTSRG